MCLAIPGKIEEILEGEELSRAGTVSFGGIRKQINLSFVPEAVVGDYVIVHVGIAISRIDPREAHRVFELLESSHEVS
ncbi:MAG: HypC/HybG/HupF family hydrogenase formation chaperone [Bdellovibrionales bacterium]|nr:HypC/HybG/HupF family hydrogenase formation chaperone [Bdellovibrionales bacterium]